MDSSAKDTLTVRVGESIRVPVSFEVSTSGAVCGMHCVWQALCVCVGGGG